VTDSPQQPHFANIDSESYQEHFHPGDHTLVDVRELHEWMRGHLPGAIHIPLGDLEDQLNDIPNDKPVVLVCATGVRSMVGAEFLLESGYMEVYNLSDGTMGWARKGLPIDQ
jgi:rhodanese-related sulfurtransferase